MPSISGLLATQGTQPTRDQLKAEIAKLPPAAAVFGADERAFAIANADLVPDDYGAVGVELVDMTNAGKKAKMMRYGIGAACGLLVGVVVGKYVL